MTTIRRKSPYIPFILALILAFLFFSLWSARQAATKGAAISDPDYYSKGLKYNSTRIEEQAAASQGWQLETKIEQKIISFHLSDPAGRAISKAQGRLTLYLGTDNEVIDLSAAEERAGVYLVRLPETIHGSLHAQIDFERQGARISRRLLVNL